MIRAPPPWTPPSGRLYHGWQALFAANEAAWSPLWDADIDVPGQPDLQAWLRSAQYGLLTSTRQGSADSLAPTGLTSDNYAGLVFWDAETWMYPGLLVTRPELARSVLDYRFRTRGAAAANAEKLGFKGLFYPWTSGGEGHVWTECQSWYPPHCVTQNHLQGDVALAVWQYYLATGDRGWLRERGWPLLKGIAEFWVSRVTANDDGSYSVKEVAGPDEYSNGVTDGVFTNAGAATALRNAARAAVLVGERPPGEWTRIMRQDPCPVRRAPQDLPPVRGLRRLPDQTGGHGPADISAGVADARGARRRPSITTPSAPIRTGPR